MPGEISTFIWSMFVHHFNMLTLKPMHTSIYLINCLFKNFAWFIKYCLFQDYLEYIFPKTLTFKKVFVTYHRKMMNKHWIVGFSGANNFNLAPFSCRYSSANSTIWKFDLFRAYSSIVNRRTVISWCNRWFLELVTWFFNCSNFPTMSKRSTDRSDARSKSWKFSWINWDKRFLLISLV